VALISDFAGLSGMSGFDDVKEGANVAYVAVNPMSMGDIRRVDAHDAGLKNLSSKEQRFKDANDFVQWVALPVAEHVNPGDEHETFPVGDVGACDNQNNVVDVFFAVQNILDAIAQT